MFFKKVLDAKKNFKTFDFEKAIAIVFGHLVNQENIYSFPTNSKLDSFCVKIYKIRPKSDSCF